MLNEKELKEIANAVEQIQYDITETSGCEYYSLMVITNGLCTRVEFEGITLWNSEAEEREFDESKNEYEPFEPYLRKVLNEEIKKIAKISV